MRMTAGLLIALLAAWGCDQPPAGTSPPRASSPATGAPPPPPNSATSRTAPPAPPQDGVATDRTAQPPLSADESVAAAAPEYVREKAAMGVGQKGSKYGGGIITEPIRQNFRLKERIVFIKIDSDMQMFKAANGRAPKSHEEFMEKIIQESNIPLPELPPGETYVYDPAREELMVQRPRAQEGP